MWRFKHWNVAQSWCYSMAHTMCVCMCVCACRVSMITAPNVSKISTKSALTGGGGWSSVQHTHTPVDHPSHYFFLATCLAALVSTKHLVLLWDCPPNQTMTTSVISAVPWNTLTSRAQSPPAAVLMGAGKEAIVGSFPVLLGVKLKMTCSRGLAPKTYSVC